MNTNELLNLAKEFTTAHKKWHFHILTPDCQLNHTSKHVLVLENTSDQQHFEILSDEPHMGIGQELVRLLHGDEVIKKESETLSPPSKQAAKIIERAKELTQKGIFWHHHMLFPGCKYNKHQDKWVIVFEDKERSRIIECISEAEPKNNLQHIEGLFYSQNK